jgi:hypothetical protein
MLMAREDMPMNSVVASFPKSKEVSPKYDECAFHPSRAIVDPGLYFLAWYVIVLFYMSLLIQMAIDHVSPVVSFGESRSVNVSVCKPAMDARDKNIHKVNGRTHSDCAPCEDESRVMWAMLVEERTINIL